MVAITTLGSLLSLETIWISVFPMGFTVFPERPALSRNSAPANFLTFPKPDDSISHFISSLLLSHLSPFPPNPLPSAPNVPANL